VIVRLDADGAVVADADDCSAVHVETGLHAGRLRAALVATGTGVLAEPDGTPDVVVLDVAVLRSRAKLLATRPDWSECFDQMMDQAVDRLTHDGLGLRVPVERVGEHT
jgi:hypothetical protein